MVLKYLKYNSNENQIWEIKEVLFLKMKNYYEIMVKFHKTPY